MCPMSGGSHRPQKRELILVIDDEPSVADALKMILEDHGFGVVVAPTGREGIERACRAGFSVTITDLRLPDIDGLDVIGAIRERGAGGSIILITAYGTPDIFARARDRGAIGVIPKPFSPSDIIQLITDALKKHEAADS